MIPALCFAEQQKYFASIFNIGGECVIGIRGSPESRARDCVAVKRAEIHFAPL
jgi:hypothetical protein